ncbi:MAG: ZIP family metal transporter [Clostridiales bacterium]|nr:ZIP family metal transporter [Candidatus Apopatousia equi]
MDNFANLSTVVQTLILTLITCGLTTLGSSMVFFFKNVNQTVISIMLSISAGVMIASAFFSLLIPAIEQSEKLFGNGFIFPSIGFMVGGIFVVIADIFLEKMLQKVKKSQKNSKKMRFFEHKRQFLLVSAITMHNIPEGMCVGVAVASASAGFEGGILGAVMLAIGIGIQNFPEGASVSLPMRSEGKSRFVSFLWGSLSGIVEPIFAILACVFANVSTNILPLLLAFSSGAMISVACTELIPQSVEQSKNMTTIFVLVGFVIMMILDLWL